MSVHVLSWVFKHSPVDVPGHRLVLLVLADHASEDGSGAYPGRELVAHEARVSVDTVKRAFTSLERDGHIVDEGLSPLRTRSWRVVMDPPPGGVQIAPGAICTGGQDAPQTVLKPTTTDHLAQSDGFGRFGGAKCTPRPVHDAPPQPLPDGAEDRIRAALLERLFAPTYGLWIEPLEFLGTSPTGVLHVAVPAPLGTWVETRYGSAIAAAATEALDREIHAIAADVVPDGVTSRTSAPAPGPATPPSGREENAP